MVFQGAVIREHGVTFAIVIVKQYVTHNSTLADETIEQFSPIFPGLPIVLMAQDSRGAPTYYGRSDIVNFLSRIDMRRIPWKRYTV